MPVPTVDGLIVLPKDRILLIKRKNPPYGWALPGGFLEPGESLEECLIREIEEETSLLVTGIEQFHTYSSPDRDPRLHTVSTVFIVKTKGLPKAKSDALSVGIFDIAKLPSKKEFAFDHWQIIQDWLKKYWQ
ncbi:MAG: NUDIX hydrolase [Candidatus Omnitrophica bacterium]|nr:NUDIX hydrolase [Candidatus Omnitrophota bacterium]